MGGIFGAASLRGENVVGIVLEGLRRLRFLGSDCAGLAALMDNKIIVRKERGDVEEVRRKVKLAELSSPVVLGHTRFSTHGRPYRDNAHPHLDCDNEIAVVGDGAISNYEKLRDELVMRGHVIRSRSDFEVLAHLIEDEVKKNKDVVQATASALGRVQGFFSFAVLSRDGTLLAYTTKKPMFIGIKEGAFYTISSSKCALYGYADNYIEVEGDEVAVISGKSLAVYRYPDLAKVEKLPKRLEVAPNLVEKDGFPHHMLREIYEIPYAILRTLSTVQERYLRFASHLLARARNIYIIADGTSLHAGLVATYYFTELAGLSPIAVSAAEFPLYYIENVGPGTVVIAISQSGETGDVIASVYEAKLRGATILGLTNYVGSKLAMFSNLYLPIGAGPELAVPATKTFISTLVLLYILALNAGSELGRLDKREVEERVRTLHSFADMLLSEIPSIDRSAESVAKELVLCRGGYVISRGITYPIALEGALKLKETAYVHAEGMEAGEFRHGPVVLVEKGFFTIFIVPVERRAAEATYPLITDAHRKGATVVTIGPREEMSFKNVPGSQIGLPTIHRHLAPMLTSIPLQLIAYHLGGLRKLPIDTPRYLTKAVTQ